MEETSSRRMTFERDKEHRNQFRSKQVDYFLSYHSPFISCSKTYVIQVSSLLILSILSVQLESMRASVCEGQE